jgi:hypothetical protein
MELYEPLPVTLKSTYKEGIVPAVRQQLEFLWRAVHAVTLSQSLAHSLGKLLLLNSSWFIEICFLKHRSIRSTLSLA